ncbi:hypothetical protein C8E95_2686 [Pseudonocardia autotrophica]|uniref:Uncharacterized protein n=1 Tax=Pseudonocardia autotrophica TaxID=2074 RepID=A0A1Y2MZN7_PSEAH|nr:hypothetical protein BG845_02697 [Pseudonocardia autotrophica]TDN73582.1 hypothetical protein C8E95_2686 [Pseudonocardia autotrophica]
MRLPTVRLVRGRTAAPVLRPDGGSSSTDPTRSSADGSVVGSRVQGIGALPTAIRAAPARSITPDLRGGHR